MSDPIITPTEETLALVMAEKYSSPHGERNPDWDIDAPDGPDNRYYLTRPMAERLGGSPFIHFTAADGYGSFRSATYREIAATLVESGAVTPVTRLTDDEALLERVIDASFPEVHAQQRASVRRDVRAILTGLAMVLAEAWCHCGHPVAGGTEESPAGRVLCADCVPVRCDAYPGACQPTCT